jgi:hypothetical protein
MDYDVHRQLGANQQAISTLTDEVHQLRIQVQQLTTMIAEARGGWAVLMSIGGIGALIGGAITTGIQQFLGK